MVRRLYAHFTHQQCSTNVPDDRRAVSSISVSPLGDLSVCVDGFGRVLLLENHSMTIRRMWKGTPHEKRAGDVDRFFQLCYRPGYSEVCKGFVAQCFGVLDTQFHNVHIYHFLSDSASSEPDTHCSVVPWLLQDTEMLRLVGSWFKIPPLTPRLAAGSARGRRDSLPLAAAAEVARGRRQGRQGRGPSVCVSIFLAEDFLR